VFSWPGNTAPISIVWTGHAISHSNRYHIYDLFYDIYDVLYDVMMCLWCDMIDWQLAYNKERDSDGGEFNDWVISCLNIESSDGVLYECIQKCETKSDCNAFVCVIKHKYHKLHKCHKLRKYHKTT